MRNIPLNERFQLEIDLLRLDRQRAENEAALRQAKFDLREAKVAAAEYGGSFKSFRDKLTGNREAAEIALRHEIQKAEADLASAQRQKEAADIRLTELQSELAALPEWSSLNDGSAGWHRLEAMYCMEVLAPMLVASHELLMQRRNQFNGANAGQIKSTGELSAIYSAPETAGEACRPYLLRLKAALEALGISIEIPAYFDGPTAFLSSATKFTRMDRINAAIVRTESLQKLLSKLQKELSA